MYTLQGLFIAWYNIIEHKQSIIKDAKLKTLVSSGI
jgi:hypothetical protein